jgi:rubrerythrin
MECFVRRLNIEHYRELLKTITDPEQRRIIEELLSEEEAKLQKAEEARKK